MGLVWRTALCMAVLCCVYGGVVHGALSRRQALEAARKRASLARQRLQYSQQYRRRMALHGLRYPAGISRVVKDEPGDRIKPVPRRAAATENVRPTTTSRKQGESTLDRYVATDWFTTPHKKRRDCDKNVLLCGISLRSWILILIGSLYGVIDIDGIILRLLLLVCMSST